MTPLFSPTRRRLLAAAPAAGVIGLAPPALARKPTVPEIAVAAVADGTVPAIGLIHIRDGGLGAPAVFGVRAVGDPTPARAEDRWHIGSNAKSMTASLIARLVDGGRLDWSAPLPVLLPGLPMQDAYRSVTLPDLLSHRAGLPRNSAAGLARMKDDDPRSVPERRLDYVRAALMEAPIGPIASGEGAYSNTGYVIAGVIGERLANQPFESLMQREVFVPLGIGSVAFGGSCQGEIAGHRDGAALYADEGDNPDFLRPAGGLRLTLDDWGRFVLDQMRGSTGQGRLLSRAGYRKLQTPQGDSLNGLGWGLEPAPGGRPMWSHNGSNGRWFGTVAVLPDRGRAALVVASAAGDAVEAVVNRLVVRSLDLA
jgi:CubicO group peptidase (beta-lactamase class C family)